MATLALSAIGSAVGGSLLSAIGGLSGAALGQAAGALAGRYIDQALFSVSGQPRQLEGPRLSDLNVTTSTEGAPIPRTYGRVRIAGQVIWATNFEEQIITSTQSSGQSGGGKGASGSGGTTTKSTEYRYFANFAIALTEGTVTRLGQVWANGIPLNLSGYNYRFYQGSDTQDPDSLIEAKEGAANAPAYRGVSYIIFERLPLAEFGNRLPQMNFEIYRSLDDFEQTIPAVALIPGAGEYVYENEELIRDIGFGASQPVNTHTHQGGSDWDVSIDQLQDDLPNAKNISLFVSWFGTDLRVNNCQLRPAVDNRDKIVLSKSWSVSGETRASAHLISLDEGRAAYGGTPSDETVVSAITDLTARGLKVTFNPFILMDIAASNNLEDPWSENSYQPKYPWRGRITIDPAPGQAGSPDQTATTNSQISSFIGTAQPSDFSISGTTVTYTGPAEWSLRRMVLHYAHLCAASGGVDCFLLGSEFKYLTTVRDAAGSYPFVDALIALASDVKSILPATKITYAADWSEYFGHQPPDGSGDVYFHLDPLWSDSNIDAIGIDCYWPLSDWRSGNDHLDAVTYDELYDLDYLQANINGGEGFDWYYASSEDRENQVRTPITDGAGKPWTFRYKDIHSWWSNPHYNRPAGIEEAAPTAWTPQSKPFWLMEVGCPAIHLGSNQPNVFVDPKSSESNVPYFSDGGRDDYIQRRFITAIIDHFTPGGDGFAEANNPQSSQYSGRMLDPERIYIYTWDARPYPAFPANLEIWGDGENWLRGHWLNGRTGSVSLNAIVKQIMSDYGFDEYATPSLNGVIEGYVIDHIMAARDALQPLELAFFFDSFESEGKIKFRHRGRGITGITLNVDNLVETDPKASLFELTRAQETELPRSAKVNFIDANNGYQSRTFEGQQTICTTRRVATAELPIVMEADKVQSLANKWVQETWAAREQGSFVLPPSLAALEPSDIITLNLEDNSKQLRITEINDQTHRAIKLLSIEPSIYDDTLANASLPQNTLPQIFGPSKALFLDLPLLTGNENPHAGFVAAAQSPWPGSVAFYRSPEDTSFAFNQTVIAPARIGTTLNDLTFGPCSRWDYGNPLVIEMDSGELQAAGKVSVLGGENLCAILHDNGDWELIQFEQAELIGERQYKLDGLLRAQGGTQEAMQSLATTGAAFVIIDEALAQVNMGLNEIGLAFNWRYGPAISIIGHPSYQTEQFSFTARGLRPFSPVHINGEIISGDINISWIRRSRIGGDSWELAEIPLGENQELYEIEIMDTGVAVRTIQTSTPDATYTAADQISDWGSLQSSYQIRIYQISEIYGRGSYAESQVTNQ